MGAELLTFATPEFRESAERLRQSAARYGLPATIHTPENPLVRDLRRRHPELARARRGYGYWQWKPALLLDHLTRAADGDVIFYCDAGAALIADPAPLLELARQHTLLVFRYGGAPARDWTKRDCFVLMDADTERFWNADACTSAFLLCRAGPVARAFAAAWLAGCSDPRIVSDRPNAMGRDNLPGYSEHRHDQAVLGILAEHHELPHFPDPSQYGIPHVGAPYGQVIDHHRSRRRTLRNRLGLATLPLRRALLGALARLRGR